MHVGCDIDDSAFYLLVKAVSVAGFGKKKAEKRIKTKTWEGQGTVVVMQEMQKKKKKDTLDFLRLK